MTAGLLAAALMLGARPAWAGCSVPAGSKVTQAEVAACQTAANDALKAYEQALKQGAASQWSEEAADRMQQAQQQLTDVTSILSWMSSQAEVVNKAPAMAQSIDDFLKQFQARQTEITRANEAESEGAPKTPVELDRRAEPREQRGADSFMRQFGDGVISGAGVGANAPATRFDKAGDAAVARGDAAAAKRDFERAAKADPSSAAPLVRLAGLALQDGDREAAVSYAQKALALDPTNKFAALVSGHADELKAAESKAKPVGGFETKKEPSGGSGRGAAEASLVAIPSDLSQDYASALAALSPARSPALPFIQKAQQKRSLGDKSAALLAATQAIDSDPRNPAAWTIRADLDNELGNFEGAVKDAGEALKLRADDAQALRARAYAELELGDYQAALQDILRATQLDPANGTGFLYKAMIEEKLGDVEAAKRDYAKAAALDPSLRPLADEGLRRLGAAGTASAPSAWPRKQIIRGGAIAISLLFVLLGLLGTSAGRRLTSRPPRAAPDATVLDEPSTLDEGSLLDGHYRVERELGRGGMGIVYAARDEALDRRVAIKRMSVEGGATSEDAERFLREARLIAKLKHPNIAEIYAVIASPEPLLVFEYVEGRSLDRLLAEKGRLAPADTARVVADVCAALTCAHMQQILHRDLKPSNVMIDAAGRCKVMDFGIAHQSRSAATFTRTSASGTPPYMAPEQALGSNSKASDLYTLAVMAYELLTGARPFDGPDFLEQKLQAQFVLPCARAPGLPSGMDAFFSVALQPDPTKRHGAADAFSKAFSGSV